MTKKDRTKIEINRKKEMRTKETSRMISEGGLGSETYYDIEKVASPENEIKEVQNSKEKTKKRAGKKD